MKLLIDISEEDFNFIKDLKFVMGGSGSCKTIQCNVINAIKNGTPIQTVTNKEEAEAYPIAENIKNRLTGCQECINTMWKGEQERPNNYHDSHSDYRDNIGRADKETEE